MRVSLTSVSFFVQLCRPFFSAEQRLAFGVKGNTNDDFFFFSD